MGAAPDDVYETIKVGIRVERTSDDNVKGAYPIDANATLLNMGGNATENATSIFRPDVWKVEIDKSLRATVAAVGVVRPVTVQRIDAV
jgi:hypothetical protein